jgi:CRISPR-associated protein Csx1
MRGEILKKILIAPWGNYSAWNEVIYSINDLETESKSSLYAIHEGINPDETYILALDTLSQLNSNNYSEIVKEVKKNAEEFVSKNLNICNYEIIICPGVGTFPNGRFLGNLLDYYSAVLYELSKRFDGDLEVHLDLTHGINYMPVLTYKAIKELLGILAMKNDVKLIVYNTDPYVGRDKETLNIHTVENRKVPPSPVLEGISDVFLSPMGFVNKKDKGKIGKEINQNNRIKELNRIKQNINVFLSSFIYALPLVYSTFFIRKEDIEDKIDEIINIFKSNIIVDNKGNIKELKRNAMFNEGFNTLIKAYFTSKVCEMEEFIKDELSLDEIDKMSEILFKSNSRFVKNETNNSVCRIVSYIDTDKIKNKDKSSIRKWMLMGEFRKESRDKFNIRNFLAHAGFEKNITEIYIEDVKHTLKENGKEEIRCIKEKTFLRYCKNCITNENRVKKFECPYTVVNKNGEEHVEPIDILKQLEKEFK